MHLVKGNSIPYIFTFQIPAISKEHLRKFSKEEFTDILLALNCDLKICELKEFIPINDVLSKEFEVILNEKDKNKNSVLLLDLLEEKFGIGDLSRLFYQLYQVLGKQNVNNIDAICFAINDFKKIEIGDEENNNKGYAYLDEIIKLCEEKNIAVVHIPEAEIGHPRFIKNGKYEAIKLPPLKIIAKKDNREEEERTKIQMSDLDILFGHFEIEINNKQFHTNAIFSLDKINSNPSIVNSIKKQISIKIQGDDYKIWASGWKGSEINLLASKVVDNDKARIITSYKNRKKENVPILMLYDVLSDCYDIKKDIVDFEKISSAVYVIGIAKYKNYKELPGRQVDFLISTNFEHFKPPCKYCENHVSLAKGNSIIDFTNLTNEYNSFDTFSFWEFVSLNNEFYSANHFVPERTKYHYNFLINCKKIFPDYSFCIATRIKNKLTVTGIKPSWIDHIMCPDDPETLDFVETLNSVLSIKGKVLAIPRDAINKYNASAPESKKDVEEYLEKCHDLKIGSHNKNIIIFDQAAHRFTTLSKLRQICNNDYKWKLLTIFLFINRIDKNKLMGFKDELVHYFLDLYYWGDQPRSYDECFCHK